MKTIHLILYLMNISYNFSQPIQKVSLPILETIERFKMGVFVLLASTSALNYFVQHPLLALFLFFFLLISLWLFLKKQRQQQQTILKKEKELAAISTKLQLAEKALATAKREVAKYQVDLNKYSLQMIQGNNEIEQLVETIDNFQRSANGSPMKKIIDIKKNLQSLKNDSKNLWPQFQLNFENQFPDFIKNLSATAPEQLSKGMIKHAICIRIGLSLAETAALLQTSELAVKKARYRLKRILNLENTERMNQFLYSI